MKSSYQVTLQIMISFRGKPSTFVISGLDARPKQVRNNNENHDVHPDTCHDQSSNKAFSPRPWRSTSRGFSAIAKPGRRRPVEFHVGNQINPCSTIPLTLFMLSLCLSISLLLILYSRLIASHRCVIAPVVLKGLWMEKLINQLIRLPTCLSILVGNWPRAVLILLAVLVA